MATYAERKMIRKDPEAVGAASVSELERETNQSVGIQKRTSTALSVNKSVARDLTMCPHCMTWVSIEAGWDCRECGGDLTEFDSESDGRDR